MYRGGGPGMQQFDPFSSFGNFDPSDFLQQPSMVYGPPSRARPQEVIQYITPQHMDMYGRSAPVLFGGDSCTSCGPDVNPGMVKRQDLSTDDYAAYRNYLERDHPRDVIVDKKKMRREWNVNPDTGRWRPAGDPYVLQQQQQQQQQQQYVQYVDQMPQGPPQGYIASRGPPIVPDQARVYRTAPFGGGPARQVIGRSDYMGNSGQPIGNGRVYGRTSY